MNSERDTRDCELLCRAIDFSWWDSSSCLTWTLRNKRTWDDWENFFLFITSCCDMGSIVGALLWCCLSFDWLLHCRESKDPCFILWSTGCCQPGYIWWQLFRRWWRSNYFHFLENRWRWWSGYSFGSGWLELKWCWWLGYPFGCCWRLTLRFSLGHTYCHVFQRG